jgi:hypothetical protein
VGRVDLGALHAERAENGAEETEAAQTVEATRWGCGGRPTGGGVMLRREEDLTLI